MRAKFINEGEISDLLKPKSKEELEEAINEFFKERFNMTFKEYEKLIDELKEQGVEIINIWNTRINETEIKAFTVYSHNWAIGKCLRKKDALALINAHKQYTYNNTSYKTEEDHEYIDPIKIKSILIKLKSNIQYSTKYAGDFFNLSDKYQDPEYNEWRNKKYYS